MITLSKVPDGTPPSGPPGGPTHPTPTHPGPTGPGQPQPNPGPVDHRLPAVLAAELAAQTFVHAVRQARRHTPTLTAAAPDSRAADAVGDGRREPSLQAAAAPPPATLRSAGGGVTPTITLPGNLPPEAPNHRPAGPRHPRRHAGEAADVLLAAPGKTRPGPREAPTSDEVRADVTGQATATPGHPPAGRPPTPRHGLPASGGEASLEGSRPASPTGLRSYRRVAVFWTVALVVGFAVTVAAAGREAAIAPLAFGVLFVWQFVMATPGSLWPHRPADGAR